MLGTLLVLSDCWDSDCACDTDITESLFAGCDFGRTAGGTTTNAAVVISVTTVVLMSAVGTAVVLGAAVGTTVELRTAVGSAVALGAAVGTAVVAVDGWKGGVLALSFRFCPNRNPRILFWTL